MKRYDDASNASFREMNHDSTVPHPSIEENGMTTMRLQRLHFSSSPSPRTLAISCPHSQRVSWESAEWLLVVVVLIIPKKYPQANEIENDY